VYTTIVAVYVGVRELRENLRAYLQRAKEGDEIVVTERGKAVARISAAGRGTTLERLIAEGRARPATRPKTPIDSSKLARARGSVVDLMLEDKRARDY
jgi:prevent-host-death family protein